MQLTGCNKAKITITIQPAAFRTMKSFPSFYLRHNNRALVTCRCRNVRNRPRDSGAFVCAHENCDQSR
jgi:hypothetical protein